MLFVRTPGLQLVILQYAPQDNAEGREPLECAPRARRTDRPSTPTDSTLTYTIRSLSLQSSEHQQPHAEQHLHAATNKSKIVVSLEQ